MRQRKRVRFLRHARPDSLQSMDSPVDRILHLQRSIGHQAVQRLMRSGALQAKLTVSQPGDQYEQEAEWVVEAMMRMSDQENAIGTFS
jgi:hypothetical protein